MAIKQKGSSPEMEMAEKQLENFESQVKDLTLDRMNTAPVKEVEPQTKLSQQDIERSKEIHLKPKRTIPCHPKDKFNENFREKYNFAKEYVHFMAENKEVIGETITCWTRPFGGLPAEEWDVPANKPVWGPRYLAEQIKACKYHRLSMVDTVTQNSHAGQFFGTMVVDNTIQRLDAIPVSPKKSIFMGRAA
jgi:hypothetical protein